MDQHGEGYPISKLMPRVGALFHLFVTALNLDLRVELVNTDANMANLPSRPFSGRGELSKITPPLAKRAMMKHEFKFLSERTFVFFEGNLHI